jgi:hypothetical protein
MMMTVTKFADWPLSIQLLIGVPHVLVAVLAVWFWSPTTRKQLYWYAGGLVYYALFYLIFVR